MIKDIKIPVYYKFNPVNDIRIIDKESMQDEFDMKVREVKKEIETDNKLKIEKAKVI